MAGRARLVSELFSVRDAYALVRTPSWYPADGMAAEVIGDET